MEAASLYVEWRRHAVRGLLSYIVDVFDSERGLRL